MFYFGIPYNPIMNFMAQYSFTDNFFMNPNMFANPFQSLFFNPFGNFRANNDINNNSNSIFQTKREHTTYNKAKADLLVKNAEKLLPEYAPVPPLCAKYVKNAIVKSGLGEYINGNGQQTKFMLRNNLNFKEVPVNSIDELQKLPKGTVIVYDANTPVEFSDGLTNRIGADGHVGFKIDKNTIISDRKEEMPLTDRAYAFIPV